VHCFRFVADFALPTGDIVALAREWDLVHTWCWPAADSAIVAERDAFDLDAYLVLQLPWPFPNRYTVLRIEGGDCLADDGCVVVLMATPPMDAVRSGPRHRPALRGRRAVLMMQRVPTNLACTDVAAHT
jgi:hypothetical protein